MPFLFRTTNRKWKVMSSTTEKEERFIRLPLDLHQQVATAAHAEDRTIASMLRVLVREGLQHRTEQGTRGAAR